MSLVLTVTLVYEGAKAAIFTPSFHPPEHNSAIMTILKTDLTTLHLTSGHPKPQNTRVVSPGVVKFWWTGQRPKSALYKLFNSRIIDIKVPEKLQKLHALSIQDIYMSETRDTSASPNLKKATLPSRPAFGRVQDPLPMQPTKHLPTYQPNPVRVKMEPDDSVIDLTTPPLVTHTLKRPLEEIPSPYPRKRPAPSLLPTHDNGYHNISRPPADPDIDRWKDDEWNMSSREIAMLKHLRQLEWALSSEREQLAEERRKMAEYELTLQEIRRECRQPFVVPMLLDAFVDVTRFTNMALGKKT